MGVVENDADTDDSKDTLDFLPLSSSMRSAMCGPDDDGTGRIRRSVPTSDNKLDGTCGNRVDDCCLFFHPPSSLLLSRHVQHLFCKASTRHAAWHARRVKGSPAKNGRAVYRGFLLPPIVARIPVIQYSCLVNRNLAWRPVGLDARVPLPTREALACTTSRDGQWLP
jgi:hypothetical protein